MLGRVFLVAVACSATGCWQIRDYPEQGNYEVSPGGAVMGAPPPGHEAPVPENSEPQTAAGPDMFSLELHNSCPQTVSLFIGDRPPFSSGTYTTLGSNTTTSQSGFAPQTIWIVDSARNPVSSYSVGAGSQRVEILASCTGFAPR